MWCVWCLCTFLCVLYAVVVSYIVIFFFFQAEDGIRDIGVTGVQTCALPILAHCQTTYFCPLMAPNSALFTELPRTRLSSSTLVTKAANLPARPSEPSQGATTARRALAALSQIGRAHV